MGNDTVVSFKKPVVIDDLLTETLRAGARQLLAAAIEAEVAEFLETHNGAGEKARFVRNGYLPEREIQTGIGEVAVKVPRVRDRSKSSDGIGYVSNLVPKYLRRSKSLNDFLPLLYLKGISTNDFVEVLKPLIGSEGKNLSPGVISRLKASWEQEYAAWCKREMGSKYYVYFWVDGIYLQARMEESKECVLVIIGVDERGQKDLIAMEAGYRESKESWLTLLRDLKSRGLHQSPKLAVGDGALGFWGALDEIYPDTRHQRCWFHKMGNVLDKLPKSLLSKAKQQLQAIWMAPTREQAYKEFDRFIRNYQARYPKATGCLQKDKEDLLAFYDFPAEHWVHLRTTNPIESTFASVRHRTYKSKGAFSRTTILTMVFKLCDNAKTHWRKLRGFTKLAEVVRGVKFVNGIREIKQNGSVDEGKAA